MLRKLMVVGTMFVVAVSIAAATDTAKSGAGISATEIVNRNVAARGGLQAWRSVKTMTWFGKLGAGGNQRAPIPVSAPGKKGMKIPTDPRPAEEVQLPFTMKMERPHKVRFELQFKGQTAIQTYDGVNGWKLRPYLNRLEVEPFTSDELRTSALQSELDGPLVDYAAKGTKVELEGMEQVEDRDTYKLKLTMKDGHTIHDWIDAHTFLEAKIEGLPRKLDGIEHPVEVYYRDYRPVNGLQVPFILETKVLPISNPGSRAAGTAVPAEKIAIEKVEINPAYDASLFTKPQIQTASIRH